MQGLRYAVCRIIGGIVLCSSLRSIIYSQYHQGWPSIKHFGAKDDGKTLATKAINDAMDSASRAGGGAVYFPADAFLSFSVYRKAMFLYTLTRAALYWQLILRLGVLRIMMKPNQLNGATKNTRILVEVKPHS